MCHSPPGATTHANQATAGNRYCVYAQRFTEELHRHSPYHWPMLAMDNQGSHGASGSPRCSNSTEMPSGERTKAI
jgi:hypothetical protein